MRIKDGSVCGLAEKKPGKGILLKAAHPIRQRGALGRHAQGDAACKPAAWDPQGKGLLRAALNPTLLCLLPRCLCGKTHPLARGFPGWWPSWRAAVPSRKVLQKSPCFFWVRVQVQSLLDGIPKVCRAGGSAAVSPVLPPVSRMIFTHPNPSGAREGALQQCEQRGRA